MQVFPSFAASVNISWVYAGLFIFSGEKKTFFILKLRECKKAVGRTWEGCFFKV